VVFYSTDSNKTYLSLIDRVTSHHYLIGYSTRPLPGPGEDSLEGSVMRKITHHPTRQHMLEAIETGKIGFRSHLKECEPCRILFELLSKFQDMDAGELHHSSPSLLKSIHSIPADTRKKQRAGTIRGHLVFDSWSDLAYAQLRDCTDDLTRRLILQTGPIKLEIAAERHQDTWEFTARVYDRGKTSTKFVIKIGRRKIEIGPTGFFYWSSKRPPSTVRLLGISHTIRFDGLLW